jgi:V8-like Glu-specific endopeptidase
LRRATILLLICTMAFAGAGTSAAPAGQRTDRSDALPKVRTHALRGADGATDYWTKERMRDALPAPTPYVSREAAARAAASPSLGEPIVVPPTTPRPGTDEAEVGPTRTGTGPYPYSRNEIVNTQDFPYSAHGKIFFTDRSNGLDYVCSGTIVSTVDPNDPEGDPGNGSVVWTAGHCVFLGSWHTNWVFVPAYRDGNAPLGEWPAVHLSAPAAWVDGNSLRQDLGAAVIDTDPAGRTISSIAGGRGIAFGAARASFYQSFGYPAVNNDGAIPEFSGEREFVCQSAHGADDDLQGGKGPPTMAIGCDMTGGSSGGGWILENKYVASVNSYGYDDEPEVMYGPYHGDEATALYESVRSLVLHPMIVGIRLRKHLVVSGHLTAVDGFNACEVGAIVRVFRKSGPRWNRLKSTRTNARGKYRIEIRDREGRYRVVAPSGPVDSANFCGVAVSPVIRHRR